MAREMMTESEVREVLRKRVALRRGTNDLAAEAGVSAAYVSACALSDSKPIGEHLAKALGFGPAQRMYPRIKEKTDGVE
jgi:hypothetical protein